MGEPLGPESLRGHTAKATGAWEGFRSLAPSGEECGAEARLRLVAKGIFEDQEFRAEQIAEKGHCTID